MPPHQIGKYKAKANSRSLVRNSPSGIIFQVQRELDFLVRCLYTVLGTDTVISLLKARQLQNSSELCSAYAWYTLLRCSWFYDRAKK